MAHTASTIAMQLVAMLGVRPNVSGPVAYVDDGEIQYVSGRNLVRYDIESRAQRILQGTPELAGISAVATSGNRKLSAYAEYAPDASPVIVVYEWATRRRKRTITGLDCGSAPVTHLAFTADCKHLVVQTGAPEWTLYYIALERGATARVLATHRNVAPSNKTISSVDCHPTDSTLVAITGRGFFKLLRLADDALKPIQVNLRRDPTHFTCHAWLPDDRLVLGAMNGELWLLEGGEFKRVIADAGAAALSAGSGGGLPTSAGGGSVPTGATKPVSALLPFSKGFLAGCDGGLIKVLERSEDPRSQYKHTKTFAIGSDDTSRVVGLSLSPNDDDVAIMTAAGQVHGFKLSSHELYKPGDVLFRPLISPFHTHPAHLAALASGSMAATGVEPEAALEAPPPASASTLRRTSLVGGLPASAPGVGAALSAAAAAANAAALDPLSQPNYGLTGIDVCVRKSTFITSAADRTVRVWNYAPHQGSDSMAGGGGSGGRFGGGKDGVDGASAGITATPALELVQRFPETPGCVSLHPSGFHALVGFESSLQLMNVLMDGLRAFKEFPIRNCGEAHFSHTGGMFGAVNGNTISVFGTYTCAPIVSLRAHADKVVAFAWSRDDRFIVSVSRDGVVIRHAVVVPNATSSSGSGSVPPSAGTVGLGGLTGAPSSAGGERPALVAGKAVNSYELKDLTPLAISTGANESGREVLISGILSRGGVARPVMRLVDMAASMAKDAVKADVNLGSQVVRGIECAVPSRILLAGMGASIERARPAASGPSLQPSASSAAADAPRLQERSRTVGGVVYAPGSTAGGSGAADDSSPLGGLHGSAILAATMGGSSGPAPAEPAPAAGLMAPDSAGSLRAYRLPPAADYVELVCHAGPVTRMVMLPNGRALITVGGDGSIALVAVSDLRPKSTGPTGGAGGSLSLSSAGVGAGGASSLLEDGLPFADEILVTRADLEEVRKEKSDLEARVQEIIMANRYNERYKDMSNEERLREVQDRYSEELAADRAKLEALRAAKSEMEARFEDQLAELEAIHSRELEELEVTYRAKIQGEMERYDSLVKDRDVMNEDCDAANAQLVKEQAAAVEEIKVKYEAAIAAEQAAAAELETKKKGTQESCSGLADDIEEDVDREMEDLRARYESKLQQETKATLLLRGENGFMKRKFMNVNREMTEKKEALAALADKEKELHEAIAALQKDVQGQKKEIREREETIADKESRIYDLKKKNQELEKFKFVLNYKIQELKRQIMPRKREIQEMREQMKEMELELLQYHKSNAALDLMIGELKLKRDGMARDLDGVQESVDDQDETLLKVARDVAAVQKAVHDPKALLTALTRLYHKYVHGDAGSLATALTKTAAPALGATGAAAAGGAASPGRPGRAGGATGTAPVPAASSLPEGVDVMDVQRELARQRLYLEKSLDSIRQQMEKDEVSSRVDHARLMRENMLLTQEINDLRRDMRFLQGELTAALGGGGSAGGGSPSAGAAGSRFGAGDAGAGSDDEISPPGSPGGAYGDATAADFDLTPADLAAASAALNGDLGEGAMAVLAKVLGRTGTGTAGRPGAASASFAARAGTAPALAGAADALDTIAMASAHLALARSATASGAGALRGPSSATSGPVPGAGAAAGGRGGGLSGMPPGASGSIAAMPSSKSIGGLSATGAAGGRKPGGAGAAAGTGAGSKARSGTAGSSGVRRSAAVFGVTSAPEGIMASSTAAALTGAAALLSSTGGGALPSGLPSGVASGAPRPGGGTLSAAGTGALATAGAEALRSKVASFKAQADRTSDMLGSLAPPR